MKPQIYLLKAGQRVWAIVEETMAEGEVLINYNGDLVRVVNSTEKNFRSGERVQLEVEGLSPLRFKLVQLSPRRPNGTRLDCTI